MGAVDKALELAFGPLDPAAAYHYFVEVENELAGSFVSCSGIAARREVLEIREGGVNTHTHKLPGRVTYGTLTLKKGVMFSSDMWTWFDTGSINYKVKRTSMTIVHYSNYIFLPARWYNVSDVYPVSWNVTDFDASSSSYSVDTLEVAFSTIKVETMPMMQVLAKLGV
jgi:phage tail-like protein